MTFHSVRATNLAALGVLMCTAVHLAAQIDSPAISLEELVKIVETSQRKHARVLANYDLKYGTTDQDNPYDSEFVHTKADFSVSAEVAIDYPSGKQWLSEAAAHQGSLNTFKYLYNGKITRKLLLLRRPPEESEPERLGLISDGQLPYLGAGEPHHPRPGDVTFWGIPGRDLADALGSMSNGQVSRATINGKAVPDRYLIRF